MTKLEQAARALLVHWDTPAWKYLKPTGDLMAALREALDHSGEANEMVEFFSKEMKNKISVARAEQAEQEPSCNQHPDAPHGFDRNASHNAHRYVCECEGWEPEQADGEQWSPDDMAYRPSGLSMEQAEQEPFDMNDHPPHRLCECRKCMEYFTPLPDCDAFAASGKPIAEQTNTQFMEGYRIGLAEMREKCAKVCDEKLRFGSTGVLEADKATTYTALDCAAAIRAIKFEGDTGFRPVSEMIAEHKQDPKKAAAIEKAKMRKAEQKPVAYLCPSFVDNFATGRYETCEQKDYGAFPVYSAPVRTKDLTDDEIVDASGIGCALPNEIDRFRDVIAADREKNK